MEKTKKYRRTRFSAGVVEEANNLFRNCVQKQLPEASLSTYYDVGSGDESFALDTREEFLAEYPRSEDYTLKEYCSGAYFRITNVSGETTHVDVRLPTRNEIEAVFQVFERHVDESRIAAEPLTVFIGHGHDSQWRDLKDHLHEQHGINVKAYEVGPRAGMSVKEVLEQLISESSFALLVLTGEDLRTDGELHARDNVIHEVGLFQGCIGFTRAIVLLEEGISEFSNILGINQIRFPKGGIRETFGDVLATIRREFG